MCCFSQAVRHVSATRIFARTSRPGHQYVVYSMTLDAAADLAMILPLPVPKGTRDDAVKFVDLSGYAEFFEHMDLLFPAEISKGGGSRGLSANAMAPQLAVVQVGSFEASFVPTQADFGRLDSRFRIAPQVWAQLPQYAGAGFAVFKLKAGEHKVHPMAFEFPTANAGDLFFPTVHIHDGKVHANADFDHQLYCQVGSAQKGDELLHGWEESPVLLDAIVKASRCMGLVDGPAHVFRKTLKGSLPNRDITLRV